MNEISRFNGFGRDGRRIYHKGGGGDPAAAQREMDQKRQQNSARAMEAVNQQFGGFGDDYFKNIADAYVNFQKPLYDEQLAKARRELPYQFSSTDNSEYQRSLGALERDAARQEAQIRDSGTDFANQERGQVEQNRSDLINLANAGTDASAVASMGAARSAALAKPPVFSPIADLFAKYTANFANAQASQPQGVMQRQTPLTFPSATRGAVRTVG